MWCYGWLVRVLRFLVHLVVVCVGCIGILRELAKVQNTQNPRRARARRNKLVILVVFVVCFLPYHVLRVLRVDTRRKPETPCMLDRGVHAAYILSRPLAGLNTFFNLALYTLAGDKFKQAFQSMFKLKNVKSRFHLAVISRPNTATESM